MLNNNKLPYPILFDFDEPWKIDLLDFLNENYMDNLSMEQIVSFIGRSLATALLALGTCQQNNQKEELKQAEQTE